MPYDPRLAVQFAALDASMRARIFDLDQMEVDRLRAQAERDIPYPGDPLRRAVINFAIQYELHRHDRAEMDRLGAQLRDVVDSMTVPTAPSQRAE